MATGHILPGYGEPVTRLRRLRSIGNYYPLDSSVLREFEQNTQLSQKEFNHIKENARQLWGKQTNRATTYNTYFNDGEIREKVLSRPTSSHRRNKPHPTQLFMTNKLHFIEGYHKPDMTVGKEAYKIDASVNPDDQKQRQGLREKYIARPDSTFTRQYRDTYGFKTWLSPREAQAAEAWVKLADDTDQYNVLNTLKEQADILKQQHGEGELRSKSAFPSLHRWMRLSGTEEQDKISRIMQRPNSNLTSNFENYDNGARYIDNTSHEYVRTRTFSHNPQLKRGEYSIHPGWPASIPHHRVP